MTTAPGQIARPDSTSDRLAATPLAPDAIDAERIRSDGGIDVWSVRLDRDAECVGRLRDVLSDDERARADAFRFTHLRERYTVCRGTVRHLLGRWLDRPASSVRLRINAFGKPMLEDQDIPVRFNISHSDDCALFAICGDGREVGVDIERMVPMADLEAVAATVFSAGERRQLHALDGADRVRAFYNGWTRKEAYVKALGVGLQASVQTVEVALTPVAAAGLLQVERDPDATRRWALESLPVAAGFVAAVCYERSGQSGTRPVPRRGH
jgi:4'-phosphopantetheinyl transferase